MVPPAYFGNLAFNKAWLSNELQYGFQSRLKQSVQKEGFRNPVLVWHDKELIAVPYGHSRAWLAFNIMESVPAFVVDKSNDSRWDDFEDIFTIDQVLSKFKDLPAVVEFQTNWFTFWGCDHVHLEPEHQEPFKGRQLRRNVKRLTWPKTLDKRLLWWYRDIPSDTVT